MSAMIVRLVFLEICPSCDDGARAPEGDDVTATDGSDRGTGGIVEAPCKESWSLGKGARCGKESEMR